MAQLKDVLNRADIGIFQDILGDDLVALLRLLHNELRVSDLRKMLYSLYSEESILREKRIRNKIFELLRDDEVRKLIQSMRIPINDRNPYKLMFSQIVPKGSPRERLLFNFFGIHEVIYSSEIIPNKKLIEPQYSLFDHQINVILRVQEFFRNNSRCILHMPTGSGKTRTAMNIISEHLRTHGGVVVWLAYSNELCEQAIEEFEKAWSFLGNKEITIYRFWGEYTHKLEELDQGFVVAGFSKLFNTFLVDHNQILALERQVSLIVIDEAHQSIAPTYKTIIETLSINDNTKLLGLTATPGRTSDNITEDEKLSSFFGRNKFSLEIPGFSNPVQYLIDNGYLAKTTFFSLDYNGEFILSSNDMKQISESLDVPLSILNRLAKDSVRNLKIIFKIKELITDGHMRIILFATTVKHAKEISALLNVEKIQSYFVTAETNLENRKNIIDYYKSDANYPIILCNFGVLTTGFDAPRTSSVIIARPTKSLVLYSQMVGRAIRGPLAGGNDHAIIYTMSDFNLPGFNSLHEAFMNWDDVYGN